MPPLASPLAGVRASVLRACEYPQLPDLPISTEKRFDQLHLDLGLLTREPMESGTLRSEKANRFAALARYSRVLFRRFLEPMINANPQGVGIFSVTGPRDPAELSDSLARLSYPDRLTHLRAVTMETVVAAVAGAIITYDAFAMTFPVQHLSEEKVAALCKMMRTVGRNQKIAGIMYLIDLAPDDVDVVSYIRSNDLVRRSELVQVIPGTTVEECTVFDLLKLGLNTFLEITFTLFERLPERFLLDVGRPLTAREWEALSSDLLRISKAVADSHQDVLSVFLPGGDRDPSRKGLAAPDLQIGTRNNLVKCELSENPMQRARLSLAGGTRDPWIGCAGRGEIAPLFRWIRSIVHRFAVPAL